MLTCQFAISTLDRLLRVRSKKYRLARPFDLWFESNSRSFTVLCRESMRYRIRPSSRSHSFSNDSFLYIDEHSPHLVTDFTKKDLRSRGLGAIDQNRCVIDHISMYFQRKSLNIVSSGCFHRRSKILRSPHNRSQDLVRASPSSRQTGTKCPTPSLAYLCVLAHPEPIYR